MYKSPLQKNNLKNRKQAFTLVEMLVAVFIFSIVLTIATGAMVSVVSANKTSHALKSVIDNLNTALENMSRNIRYGSVYICADANDINIPLYEPKSCLSGKTMFIFEGKDGTYITAPPNSRYYSEDQISYRLVGDSIIRCEGFGDKCLKITGEEVHIESLMFYVVGAETDDNLQPMVTITVKGYAGNSINDPHRSEFNIQTIVSQRNFDKPNED